MENKSEYLTKLEENLSSTYEMLDLLNTRLQLLRNSDGKSPYEINEGKILAIKTKAEVETLQRIINEKRAYFEAYRKQFILDCKEMDNQFDFYLQKANKLAASNEAINNVLIKSKYDIIDRRIDVKLAFYKSIKRLVDGHGK